MRTLAWAVAIIYSTIPAWWLLIHPFAGRWRKMRRSPYRALVPIWIAMWVVAAALTWPWHDVQLYSTPFAWLATLALLAISVPIYRRTSRSFGRPNLIGQSELRPEEFEQQLVTTGLHARMRHPVYLAHLCTISAFTISSGMLVNYCLLAFAIVTGAVMIKMEEQELAARFGDQWREYKKNVRGLLPFRRFTPPGQFKSVDTFASELLQDLPEGAAKLEVKEPARPGFPRTLSIIPTNPRSAKITLTDDFDVFIGGHFIEENYYRCDGEVLNEVRELCLEVFGGRIEAIVWKNPKGEIIKAITKLPRLDRKMRYMRGLPFLHKKTRERISYEPYGAGQ